jgi:hypothetical protein
MVLLPPPGVVGVLVLVGVGGSGIGAVGVVVGVVGWVVVGCWGIELGLGVEAAGVMGVDEAMGGIGTAALLTAVGFGTGIGEFAVPAPAAIPSEGVA